MLRAADKGGLVAVSLEWIAHLDCGVRRRACDTHAEEECGVAGFPRSLCSECLEGRRRFSDAWFFQSEAWPAPRVQC